MKKVGLAFSVVLSIIILVGAATAIAAEYGTPAEAKAMLEKAVAAVKKDKAKALEMFTKGEGGFKDRDLYVFCGGPDGMYTAHPKRMGKSLKDDKDYTGNPTGAEIYKAAQEGKISEVSYKWPRPGSDKPIQKVAFVTKVDDEVCAVGYYK